MNKLNILTSVAAIAFTSILSASPAFAQYVPAPITLPDLYQDDADVYVSGENNSVNLEQVGAKTSNAAIAIGKNNKNSNNNKVNVIQNNQESNSANVTVNGSKNDVQLLQKNSYNTANINLNSDNNEVKANQTGIANILDVKTNDNVSLNATINQDGVGGSVLVDAKSKEASTTNLLVNQSGTLNTVDYKSSKGKNDVTINQIGDSNLIKANVSGGQLDLAQDGSSNAMEVESFSGGKIDLGQKGDNNKLTVAGTKVNATAKQVGNQNQLLISADSNGFLSADVKQNGDLNKAKIYNFSSGGEANVANLTQNGNNVSHITFEGGNTGGNVANVIQSANAGHVGVTIGGTNNAVTVKK